MAASPHPAVQQALALAGQYLQRRDLAGAEQALMPLGRLGLAGDPNVLNMLGSMRLHQNRFAEAESLLVLARKAAPREPNLALNLARALAGQGRNAEAGESFRAAIKLKPDFVEARFEAAQFQHRIGALDEAENGFRQLLRVAAGNVHAKLALGAVLIDAGRPQDAEAPLRRALDETTEPRLKAELYVQLSMALCRQRKDTEALAACDSAEALDPATPGIALNRAEALQNLQRHDEALAIFQALLARAPGDPALHHAYNDLLYRLNRKDDYLKSYDRAPQSRPLLLGKAFFLGQEKRDAECHAVYVALLARDPDDRIAAMGAATALVRLNRCGEAVAAFDALLARHGGNANMFGSAALPALIGGDPQKAAWLCEQGLALAPGDANCLATLSIASRIMDDGRDEAINGYDSLVRSFDLEPPEGFSDMASFNAELNAALDRLHPETREFIGQSLRGGTQTHGSLFGTGHVLVDKLRQRIDEAVARYIAELKEDAAHPFLSRRTRDFRYAGSWSSRLRDCGFHVNHLHPMGWISSCYYVAVPEAARDETARQGWIKFGEPSFDVALNTPTRRAIQPVAGRLVLFPSYTWHGTNPFRDAVARTTIAFDAVPLT